MVKKIRQNEQRFALPARFHVLSSIHLSLAGEFWCWLLARLRGSGRMVCLLLAGPEVAVEPDGCGTDPSALWTGGLETSEY